MFLRILSLLVLQCVIWSGPAFGQGGGVPSAKKENGPKKPNVIFILIDDMGYECLGAYGSASYKTPNLDKLAANAVKFTHCYSTALCSPSRVQLMTGKYNFRNYEAFGYLNPKEKTFGNYFKEAGYTTCISGKWQLNGLAQKLEGNQDTQRPNHFGFDEYCLWQLQYGRNLGERYANPLIVQNGKTLPRQRDAYGPDVFCDYIVDFIDRNKNVDKPFFAYYSMPLVHDPFVPTPNSRDWSGTALRYKEDTAYFKDMVTYMDKNVGLVLDKLEQTGLAENTLVIITGDNGTSRAIYSRMQDGSVVRGDKGKLTDGGTREPLIAYWKGKSPKGTTVSDLVDFSDFLPTMLQAAGIPLPKDQIIDGRSFLPQILGKPAKPKEYIYVYYEPKWYFQENGVFVRNKTYKLYGDGRFYNVQKDVLEQNDLNGKTLTTEEKAAKKGLQGVLAKMPNVKPVPESEKEVWRQIQRSKGRVAD
jgi:arylsulfatase A